jgi:hypothetical protein
MNTTIPLKWLPLAAVAFFFSSASPLAYASGSDFGVALVRISLPTRVDLIAVSGENSPSCHSALLK